MNTHIPRIVFATIALVFALAITEGVNAQNFKQSGKTPAELYTKKSNSMISAQGDFDKDGKKDLVIAVNQDYTDVGDGTDFAFYFGNAQGGYTLFRAYDASVSENSKITVTDKGVVRIESPAYDDGTDVFLFRFQDGDFYLIGGKKDRHKKEHYDISYNFLTGKQIKTSSEGKAKKSENGTMQKMPKLRFGWFPLCFNMLNYLFEESETSGDMEYQTVMGIFRLMQSNDMLFWHFCDYENPYRNPQGDDGGWTAYDELMKPACYNAFSQLSISKQSDGSYLLDLSETFEDRSYEQQLNEDMSNIDEIEIPDNNESTTETKWIFKDGVFKMISKTEGK